MEPGIDAPVTEGVIRLVEQVGRGLKGKRQYSEAVRAAAECVVPTLADLAVAFVHREGKRDSIEVIHIDETREPQARALIVSARDVLRRVASHSGDRQWWWVPSVRAVAFERLTRDEHALGQLIDALEVYSLIAVPLRASGRLHGVLALARTTSTNPFTVGELAAAQVIGRQAAVAIEAAEVTEGLHTEAAKHTGLDDALRKWTSIFQGVGCGVAIVDDEDHRIDAANPAFARMHGGDDPDALIGRHFAEFLPADYATELDRWDTAELTAYDSIHCRPNGVAFPVRISVTHLDDRHIHVYVVTVQDLTDLKRAEERLHQAQRTEAVGRLAGGVAHEVNNMMTIILGFSDILTAKGLPDEQQRDVEEIRKAATRAGNITRQLLAFGRQQLLQPAPVRLNDVVAEMAPVLRLMLPANVRLEVTLAPAGGTVRADRVQLEQVLINLVFNARDAMPDGGTIRLATEFRHLDEEMGRRLIGIPIRPGPYGLFSLIDTGFGMDRATLSQIFEPFFTTKPSGQGTGLGLATVYGIVKQCGGYIWAESAVGCGSTVTVCLPEIDRPASVPLSPAGHVSRRHASGTVLVVEHEGGVRELASRLLRQGGYHVIEASSGAAAIQFLADANRQVDLLLTDVVIPDVELRRIERQAHQRRLDLPILYMSGYPQDEITQRGLITADQPFLQKPFTSAELLERVQELLVVSGHSHLPGSGLNST